MNAGKGWLGMTVGAALLAGCASEPRQVNCDRHLEPINLPAPKVPPSLAIEGAAPSSPGQRAP